MTEIICCKAGGGIVMWWSWEGLVVASMQNILVIPVNCGHRMMPHNLTGMLTNTNGVVDPSVFNSFQFTKLSVQFGTAYFPMRCPAKSKLDIPKSWDCSSPWSIWPSISHEMPHLHLLHRNGWCNVIDTNLKHLCCKISIYIVGVWHQIPMFECAVDIFVYYFLRKRSKCGGRE